MRQAPVFGAALLLAATLVGARVCAQPPAFPGAEGVAKFVSGGRGGDVYKVTNLNDSGPGSLRYGIQEAPASGRTIVFDMAGTIALERRIDFNGKDKITIAGQTAPGGGITLTGGGLRINPVFEDDEVVDPVSNIIIQHLRVRPGKLATNSDGVWIQTATDVMIDHVATAWSADEGISATHDSDNVTVQWSTMTQGLFDHSFGSLLNGGRYTYAHNLYAHNKSRNPRLQQSQSRVMEIDFVNNVIYNPQERFAYGGGRYFVNFVGNYGVRGPGTTDTNHQFVRDTDVESHFFVADNLMDNNTNGQIDGVVPVLEGGSHDAGMFREGQAYTLLEQRAKVAPMPTTSAAEAYVQVLSRVGPSRFRDAHDRDMIRDTVNQQPGFVKTESEWGPAPELPSGPVAKDSNSDGVPDDWAVANFGDATTPLNLEFHASGYTYLERYLHTLTPRAFPPAEVRVHTITTAYGRGADAQVAEDGGTQASSSGDGLGGTLGVVWDGVSGTKHQAILLRFDLSHISPGSVAAAALELTAARDLTGARRFKVWCVEHDGPRWDWEEATVSAISAPALVFDGNSQTLGVDPRYTSDGEPAARDNQPLAVPGVFALGDFSIQSMAAGSVARFESLNLAVVLNLASYFENAPQAGLVTLALEEVGGATAESADFWSKEGNADLAPKLVISAVGAAESAQHGN